MIVFCTHPENAKWLQENIEGKLSPRERQMLDSIEIRTMEHLPIESHSGRYILPDGSAVVKDDVVVKHQFVTYGPEDIDHLLYRGVIKKEMQRHFYKTDPVAMNIRAIAMQFQIPRSVFISTAF